MRKLSLLIALCFFQQFIAEAQRLGIKGGLDILGVNYIYQEEQKKSNPQMGFHIGMAVEFKLSNSFALSSGLLFTEKGFKEDYQLADKDKTTFFYLDIPALLVYKTPFRDNNLYLHAGPYIALGLFTNLTGTSFESEKGFGDEPGQYGHYDLGMGIGGGMEFDVWRFGLYYNVGLLDIRNASDTNVRNQVVGLDVAYMFGQR